MYGIIHPKYQPVENSINSSLQQYRKNKGEFAENETNHAHNIARVALRMLRYIERRNSAHPEAWHCRIGINSGPMIGSLVGIQKYVYDIFGPGINMAARMETLSESMRITISESTYRLIKDEFVCTERGEFEVKGFGASNLYYLEREHPHLR